MNFFLFQFYYYSLTLLKMILPMSIKHSEVFLRKWSTSLFRKWATQGNYPDFIEQLAKNLPSKVFKIMNQTINNCVI